MSFQNAAYTNGEHDAGDRAAAQKRKASSLEHVDDGLDKDGPPEPRRLNPPNPLAFFLPHGGSQTQTHEEPVASTSTIPPSSSSLPQEEHDSDMIDEEPLYVNAKQYHRIIKRRAARARLQELHKIATRNTKHNGTYMHESRHRHAVKRPRGPGGRFLTADEIAALKAKEQGNEA